MWQSVNSSMWTIIESNLGIICACMPALYRPLAQLFPWLFGKATGRSTRQYRRYVDKGPYGSDLPIRATPSKSMRHALGNSVKVSSDGVFRGAGCSKGSVMVEMEVLQEREEQSRRGSQDTILVGGLSQCKIGL